MLNADSFSLLVRGLQRLLLECGLLCQFPQRRWRRNCHQLPWIHYSAKKFHYILVSQMIAYKCVVLFHLHFAIRIDPMLQAKQLP